MCASQPESLRRRASSALSCSTASIGGLVAHMPASRCIRSPMPPAAIHIEHVGPCSSCAARCTAWGSPDAGMAFAGLRLHPVMSRYRLAHDAVGCQYSAKAGIAPRPASTAPTPALPSVARSGATRQRRSDAGDREQPEICAGGEAHGGRVQALNTHSGCRFVIRLPATPATRPSRSDRRFQQVFEAGQVAPVGPAHRGGQRRRGDPKPAGSKNPDDLSRCRIPSWDRPKLRSGPHAVARGSGPTAPAAAP